MTVRFSRVELAIGKQNVEILQRSRVAMIGLGAVGGFAAEALTRSGIGTLRLIDMDCIQQTDINRQIIALDSTIGNRKVDAAAARLRDINPDIHIEKFCEFFHSDTAESLLDDSLDFVVDAIDAVGPKIELLAYCHQHAIPVISSMGAAFKTHFEQIKITDISKTEVCPLARTVRKGLRSKGIYSGIQVIFSPDPGPPFIFPEEITSPEIATVTHRGRPRRILGSLCPIAATFGMLAANYVIWELIDKQFLPPY